MWQKKESLSNWECLVEPFASTFISRRDCYPQQLPDGSYISVKKPLTPDLITAHVQGKLTLGAYALDAQSMAHWLCLDADDDREWQQLLQLTEVLQSEGLTPYLELSRRGGHLWLFTAPLSGRDMRRFGKQLLARHSISDQIELYPKQDQLKTGPGSLVRLPLGIHRKTGRRYHFITLKYEPLAPTIRQQLAILSNPTRVPDDFIQQILTEIPPTPPSQPPTFAKAHHPQGETLSERLKAAISVRDFVARFVELDERLCGFCPFHDDQHKSFGVNDRDNYWSCWAGCGGGTIIDFAMKWREKHGQDGSFTATITALAQMLLD